MLYTSMIRFWELFEDPFALIVQRRNVDDVCALLARVWAGGRRVLYMLCVDRGTVEAGLRVGRIKFYETHHLYFRAGHHGGGCRIGGRTHFGIGVREQVRKIGWHTIYSRSERGIGGKRNGGY